MKLHTLITIDRLSLPKLQAYLMSLFTHNFNLQATDLCKLQVPLKKNNMFQPRCTIHFSQVT